MSICYNESNAVLTKIVSIPCAPEQIRETFSHCTHLTNLYLDLQDVNRYAGLLSRLHLISCNSLNDTIPESTQWPLLHYHCHFNIVIIYNHCNFTTVVSLPLKASYMNDGMHTSEVVVLVRSTAHRERSGGGSINDTSVKWQSVSATRGMPASSSLNETISRTIFRSFF